MSIFVFSARSALIRWVSLPVSSSLLLLRNHVGSPALAGSWMICSILSISVSDRNPALLLGSTSAFLRIAVARFMLTPFTLATAYGAFRVPSTSASIIRSMCRNSSGMLSFRPCYLETNYVQQPDFI